MTRFLTQELLFEYISGSLHPSRHRMVEEHLESDRESQRELLNLSKGLEYAHEIGRLHVSKALHDALLNFEPAWKKQLRAWTRWSSRRGWKLLPYAFTGLAVTLSLAVTKPWRRGPVAEVELAEHAHVEPHSLEKQTERVPASVEPEPIPAVVTATESPTLVAAAPAASPVIAQPPTPPPVAKPAPPPPVVVEEAPPASGDKTKPMAKGALMRGEIAVAEFAKAWPSIRSKIIALKGEAAGNVELGWLRRKDQSYFHFSIPEANYAKFEKFLGTFGRVQIHQEGSPRIMPTGQIRIILTVKDGGSGDEGSAKAP